MASKNRNSWDLSKTTSLWKILRKTQEKKSSGILFFFVFDPQIMNSWKQELATYLTCLPWLHIVDIPATILNQTNSVLTVWKSFFSGWRCSRCLYIITKTIDRHGIILSVTCEIISVVVRTRELWIEFEFNCEIEAMEIFIVKIFTTKEMGREVG